MYAILTNSSLFFILTETLLNLGRLIVLLITKVHGTLRLSLNFAIYTQL